MWNCRMHFPITKMSVEYPETDGARWCRRGRGEGIPQCRFRIDGGKSLGVTPGRLKFQLCRRTKCWR